MTRQERFAHRRRIGKNWFPKGTKIGYSIAVYCLVPPPGETVPEELAKCRLISGCPQERWEEVKRYLRVFEPKHPTRYQTKKLKNRILRRYPQACNFWAQPSYHFLGSEGVSHASP